MCSSLLQRSLHGGLQTGDATAPVLTPAVPVRQTPAHPDLRPPPRCLHQRNQKVGGGGQRRCNGRAKEVVRAPGATVPRRLSRKRRRGPRRGKTEGQGLRAGTARAALLVSGGNLELAGDCHAKPHSQGTMASSGNNSGCHEGDGWSQRPRTPGAAPSPPRQRTVTELGVRGRGGTEGAAKDSGPVRGSERRGDADNGRAATEGGLWNQREVGVTDQTTQAIAEAVSGPPSRRRPLSQQTSAGQPLWASCFLRSGFTRS